MPGRQLCIFQAESLGCEISPRVALKKKNVRNVPLKICELNGSYRNLQLVTNTQMLLIKKPCQTSVGLNPHYNLWE